MEEEKKEEIKISPLQFDIQSKGKGVYAKLAEARHIMNNIAGLRATGTLTFESKKTNKIETVYYFTLGDIVQRMAEIENMIGATTLFDYDEEKRLGVAKFVDIESGDSITTKIAISSESFGTMKIIGGVETYIRRLLIKKQYNLAETDILPMVEEKAKEVKAKVLKLRQEIFSIGSGKGYSVEDIEKSEEELRKELRLQGRSEMPKIEFLEILKIRYNGKAKKGTAQESPKSAEEGMI